MIYENTAFGADPELFLKDYNGKYRSAVGLIGGTKEFPRRLDDFGSAVQEDNVAVEFNIIPALNKQQFRHNIEIVLSYLHVYVEAMALQLSVDAAAFFEKDQLDSPEAQKFGCDPDFNVWTKQRNPRPPELTGRMAQLRSCGGHVHVSWDKVDSYSSTRLIKAMDLFLGCPSIELDSDKLRRELYGKAGAFRFKPYGVEYRVLSNFWIKSPDMVDWVYDQTEKAIDYLNGGGVIEEDHELIIQKTINDTDKDGLKFLTNLYPI